MPEILPTGAPHPRAILLWDGTAWRVQACDVAGRAQVRGEDQFFSITDRLALERAVVVSGADGWVESDSPPAGQLWVVTNITAHLAARALTRIMIGTMVGAIFVTISDELRAFAAGERSVWTGMQVLTPGDTFRAYYFGALAADLGYVDITGYRMTLEV